MDILNFPQKSRIEVNENLKSPSALPQECIEDIIEFLAQDLGTLRSLLTVNRAVFLGTVRLLYRSPFDLIIHSPKATWGSILSRTEQLVRIMLGCVDLPNVCPPPVKYVESQLGPLQNGAHHSILDTWDVMNMQWFSQSENGEQGNGDSGGSDQQEQSLIDLWSESDGEEKEIQLQEQPEGVLPFAKATQSGLLLDYFQFYTDFDHRSVESVLSRIFPGSGRREYQRILTEIELGLIRHCPERLQSYQIRNPTAAVPALVEVMDKLSNLKRVEIFDGSWSRDELDLVFDFLKAHTQRFPARSEGCAVVRNKDDAVSLGMQEASVPASERMSSHPNRPRRTMPSTTSSSSVSTARSLGLRAIKYRTNKGPWDGSFLVSVATLTSSSSPELPKSDVISFRFDPAQLFELVGRGIESIDTTVWPEIDLCARRSLEYSKLRKLSVCYPNDNFVALGYCTAEFLKTCRWLEHLVCYSTSEDLFSWAVDDIQFIQQQAQKLGLTHRAHRLGDVSNNSVNNSRVIDNDHGWQQLKFEYLVPIQHLELQAFDSQVSVPMVYDAMFGFQCTLTTIKVRCRKGRLGECAEEELLWFGMQDKLKMIRQSLVDTLLQRTSEQYMHDGERDDWESFSEVELMDQELTTFMSLRSTFSEHRRLSISWIMPRLTILELQGPIAEDFDPESLRWMPQLRTLSLSIMDEPRIRMPVKERQQGVGPAAAAAKWTPSSNDVIDLFGLDLVKLKHVVGPRLKRLILQGPWPSITDGTLKKIIIESPLQDQLEELSVTNNRRVTYPAMIDLAREMENLKCMRLERLGPRNSTDLWELSDESMDEDSEGEKNGETGVSQYLTSFHYESNSNTLTNQSLDDDCDDSGLRGIIDAKEGRCRAAVDEGEGDVEWIINEPTQSENGSHQASVFSWFEGQKHQQSQPLSRPTSLSCVLGALKTRKTTILSEAETLDLLCKASYELPWIEIGPYAGKGNTGHEGEHRHAPSTLFPAMDGREARYFDRGWMM